MSFVDVPYDIDYRGCARDAIEGTQRKPIANDDLGADFDAFLARVVNNTLVSTSGVSYICIGQQRAHTLREVWLRAGGHLSTFVVWSKSHFVLGGGDYNPRFELLLYGWRESAEHPWYGPANESNVWEIDKPAANPYHPTQKPLELVARAIRNSSRPGETALDVCAGSGSTLIACEQLGRCCAAVEIDPAYVDVIIERWQALTGEDAMLDATGQTFAEIAEERRGVPCR
jgi:DNA modification methylase